jgi:hypothetical protein
MPAMVLAVEQAGVARKGAVGLDALEVEGGEFELGWAHGRDSRGLGRVKRGPDAIVIIR